MDDILEVTWKDSERATSPASMLSRVQGAFDLKRDKVIVELREEDANGRPYAARDGMPWDMLNEIAGRFGPPNLIFKATQTSQRTGLILAFGQAVNLAGVPVNEILTIDIQRLGVTPETLGLSRPAEDDA